MVGHYCGCCSVCTWHSGGLKNILTIDISLDLREEELADDAVEAGLQGSFFRRRALSRPFSLGEGRGVPRGEAGSWWRDIDFLILIKKFTEVKFALPSIDALGPNCDRLLFS